MLSFTDKRGVSEMLGYVMLIIIALALSGIVFAYLKVFVPKDKPECPNDIAVKIREASCLLQGSEAQLNISLENNGLFTIDALYVRFGLQGRKILSSINDPDSEGFYVAGLTPQGKILWQKNLTSSSYSPGNYTIEVQPSVLVDKSPVICQFVTQENVECN